MPTRFCRHIRINGERCGSPALRSEVFCYYHVELGKRHRRTNPRTSQSIPTILHPMTLQDGVQREPVPAEYSNPSAPDLPPLDFPPLEDRHSIQLALSMLITALAQGRIDPKAAALLFYGLQVASSNARDLNPLPPPDKRLGKVSLTVLDDATGNLIAPDEDPEDPEESKDYERMGSIGRYLKELEEERAERDRLAADLPPRLDSPHLPEAARPKQQE